MEKYFLDEKLSFSIYADNKFKIVAKDCYHNIFKLISNFRKKFVFGEWKIAYGYVSSVDNIFCRHCFILFGDKVIDPTVYATKLDNSNRVYFVFRKFNTLDDYLDAIETENGYPALNGVLRKDDMRAQKWALDNGYIFLG